MQNLLLQRSHQLQPCVSKAFLLSHDHDGLEVPVDYRSRLSNGIGYKLRILASKRSIQVGAELLEFRYELSLDVVLNL